jgi:putative acetyltransferase
MFEFITAHSDEHYQQAALLFEAYAAWLNIDLGFQHFEAELLQLKKMYAAPHGGIILCKQGDEYIACVGIRKLSDREGELKRMFVLAKYQGNGIGDELLNQSLLLAKKCGYDSVKLDTLNTMTPAMKLYEKNGFKQIPAYYHNPMSTAVYFEKNI